MTSRTSPSIRDVCGRRGRAGDGMRRVEARLAQELLVQRLVAAPEDPH